MKPHDEEMVLEEEILLSQKTKPLHKRLFNLEDDLTEKESAWLLGSLIFLSGFVESFVEFLYTL